MASWYLMGTNSQQDVGYLTLLTKVQCMSTAIRVHTYIYASILCKWPILTQVLRGEKMFCFQPKIEMR